MSNIVIINKRKAVRIISGDLRKNDCADLIQSNL